MEHCRKHVSYYRKKSVQDLRHFSGFIIFSSLFKYTIHLILNLCSKQHEFHLVHLNNILKTVR